MKYWPLIGLLFLGGCHKKHSPLSVSAGTPAVYTVMLAGQSNMNIMAHNARAMEVLTSDLSSLGGRIEVIACAVDGSSIAEWQPDGIKVANCEQIAGTAKIDAIFFYQGEADAIKANFDWPNEFAVLVRYWRTKYGNIPIVYAQIGNSEIHPEMFPPFRDVQATFHLDDRMAMIRTVDLPINPNDMHLTSDCQPQLAERFSSALLGLL